MRIGMILDERFPPDPRVENEISTLIKAGHEVFLYSFRYDNEPLEEEQLFGITVYRDLITKFTYKLSALAYTFPFYHNRIKHGIKKFITKYKVDVLHSHDIRSARAVFLANKEFKLPQILDLHENRPEIMKFYSHVQKFPGKWLINTSTWKKFEYKYIKEADRVVVVTDAAKDYYVKNVPSEEEKFCVTPNTVRQDFVHSNDILPEITNRYTSNFTLLYVGDTALRRGTETMIKAIDILKDKIPEVKLVLVGKSKTDHVLKDLVQSLSLEKFIELEGWQDFTRFPSYISSCDIGLCPIHKNIHHETTFANKVFQYMAFAKPIIVSDCKAQEDVVNEFNCGLVFRDRDVADLAEKILTIYQDRDLREELSQNAKKAIDDKYNWETSSLPLLELYKTIRK